ncbi:DMP19 family protein [Flavivirga algicola]|uniref:DMP19 family protein n=1 Tax=Flavivirga algicola TaxID=2729136 RepID=A0ABX1RZ36_9FLAO|nr:DUF4375 domain-containing protein [Flavivirga algicola]NMH88063.1 DMP19 family protein [Flavivirga algicola]
MNSKLILLTLLIFFSLTSCNNKKSKIESKEKSKEIKQMENPYWIFKESKHFRPKLNEKTFFEKTGTDFGWYILEPLSLYIENPSNELTKGQNLSFGQKAIYYWWYLDGQVTNGGFKQFFSNGYGKYIPTIITGLEYIGDDELVSLLKKAENYYVKNDKSSINEVKIPEEYKKIVSLGALTAFDAKYLDLNESTMLKIEEYAKKNPKEFCINENGEEIHKK